MNIAETFTFDKAGEVERFPLFRKLFLALVIVLVALLSFGIGRLTGGGKGEPVRIEYDANLSGSNQSSSVINAVTNSREGIVASKNSDKYHYSYCPGAKQISEKNLVTFTSAESAEASGYTLASNCKPR